MTKPVQEKLTFWQMLKSVLAALIGVQSDKARVRDFTHGNPIAFIAMGLLIVVCFVLMIFALVSWIVSGFPSCCA